MRKIISYLKSHFREDFKPGLYLFTAIFLAITIVLNYRYDFEDSIIDSYYGSEIRMLWYFLFYGFAYYVTAIAWIVAHQKTALLRTRNFWLYSVFGLAVLGFDGGFYYHYPFTENLLPYDLRDYIYDCLSNLNSTFTILLPLWLFYYYLDRKRDDNFYGFTRENVDLRPYAWMLLVMALPIFWASFQDDFLDNYPSYKDSAANEFWGVPSGLLAFSSNWLTVGILSPPSLFSGAFWSLDYPSYWVGVRYCRWWLPTHFCTLASRWAKPLAPFSAGTF